MRKSRKLKFQKTNFNWNFFQIQNWLAFETLEQPLITEHGSTDFAQTSQNPSSSSNYAQCKVKCINSNSPLHSTIFYDTFPGNLEVSQFGLPYTVDSHLMQPYLDAHFLTFY